jgi:hypothetical protein
MRFNFAAFLCSALAAAAVWWMGLWLFNIPLTIGAAGPFFYYAVVGVATPLAMFIGWSLYAENDEVGWGWTPVALALVIWVVGGVISSPFFNARALASQIDVPAATPFADTEIPAFDPTKIPWVDEAYAEVLGNQVFGQLGAIGSSMRVGEYIRQEVNGGLYWVAPILHDGFFRYNANPAGTPGYIMISKTDDNDVRLVTDYTIRIQPFGHAAWGDKLERIVFRLAPNALRYEYRFEIDDNLKPHWVVPLYRNTIGWWNGAEIIGVVVVDATNGDAVRYAVDDVPSWVDRVYPVKLIETQIANWGKYQLGFWNTVFGRREMIQSDDGNAMVYNNGQVYLFDSLTSYHGKDESTIGFLLTNLRTKTVRHYNLAGATEWAAQLAAIGDDRVRAQEYDAAFPIPTIIEGVPTYFMALVDPASKMVRAFALVNIGRHQIVGIGTTIREAENSYRARLHSVGQAGLFTARADLITVEGRVLRWGAYNEGGNTFYTFIVEGYEDRLFTTDTSRVETAVTQVGDRVRLEVMATESYRWSVFTFDNLEFDLTYGAVEGVVIQREADARREEIQENPAIMDDRRFREFWELLSDEQREAFLHAPVNEQLEAFLSEPIDD